MSSRLGFMVEDNVLGQYGELLQEDGTSVLLAGDWINEEVWLMGPGTPDAFNSIFTIYNGVGSYVVKGLATDGQIPAVGDNRLVVTGDTRTLKDGASLAGNTAEGLFCSLYVRLAVGLPPTTTRFVVFEEASSGTDICEIRVHGDVGNLALGDGPTFSTTKSVRQLSLTEWTRLDWWLGDPSFSWGNQELRIFYGANLNAPWWEPNEILTYSRSLFNTITRWGIGLFLGTAGSPNGLEFDGLWIGHGVHRGPADGARSVRSRNSGPARLQVPTIGAAV